MKLIKNAGKVRVKARDAKLDALREVIRCKARRRLDLSPTDGLKPILQPINPDNPKLLVFTAFAVTAHYIYEELAACAALRRACRRRRGVRTV